MRAGGIAVAACLCLAPVGAMAATVKNFDSDPAVLTVTERGKRIDFVLMGGEKAEFCLAGCFVRFPDGDRAALTGDETVEIRSGSVRIHVD